MFDRVEPTYSKSRALGVQSLPENSPTCHVIRNRPTTVDSCHYEMVRNYVHFSKADGASDAVKRNGEMEPQNRYLRRV
ncbi:hypothetical protein BS47DRAFT_1346594 [Hydnum rufescens UP504]|uniref:Uncharacterized protein n=1 Tax=Hydnum rufescens UP504 TaxID=1448309 RepID=A0A9P6DUG3_9AGAM|nr:hypothetical protein BS47DRAFT_1346594 [Hydnum rufescens UP504]